MGCLLCRKNSRVGASKSQSNPGQHNQKPPFLGMLSSAVLQRRRQKLLHLLSLAALLVGCSFLLCQPAGAISQKQRQTEVATQAPKAHQGQMLVCRTNTTCQPAATIRPRQQQTKFAKQAPKAHQGQMPFCPEDTMERRVTERL